MREIPQMMGAFPVTVSDWLDAHQVSPRQRPVWLRMLAAMEATYRTHALKQIESHGKSRTSD
jgi:hypothetical protein